MVDHDGGLCDWEVVKRRNGNGNEAGTDLVWHMKRVMCQEMDCGEIDYLNILARGKGDAAAMRHVCEMSIRNTAVSAMSLPVYWP